MSRRNVADEPELWTPDQAAEYWGVSPSRARAILASRGIKRVSGYPAAKIKQVVLRQGARTDLAGQGSAEQQEEVSADRREHDD